MNKTYFLSNNKENDSFKKAVEERNYRQIQIWTDHENATFVLDDNNEVTIEWRHTGEYRIVIKDMAILWTMGAKKAELNGYFLKIFY